jgi:hypothetical protein
MRDCSTIGIIIKKTPWPEFASELYRPNDRRLSAKLVPTFADRGVWLIGSDNAILLRLAMTSKPATGTGRHY